MRFKYMALSVMMSLFTFSCIASAGNQDPKDLKFKRKYAVTPSVFLFFSPSFKIACDVINKKNTSRYLYCERDDYFVVRLHPTGDAVGEMMDRNLGPLENPKLNMQGAVLRYGTWWSNHDFACLSELTGLTCKNREGNGFFLSNEKFEPKHIPENF